MRKSDRAANRPLEQTSFAFTPVPMELLVQDVYASSRPEVQKQMLAQLVGKVYETAPVPLRARLLEQLLPQAGVLSLAVMANGIFPKIHFPGDWPETELGLADVQTVRSVDVVALVERVLQVSGEALTGLTQLLLSAPALTSSGAAAVLIAILLQHGHFRRASDRVASPPRGMYPT
mgnify:FL=1